MSSVVLCLRTGSYNPAYTAVPYRDIGKYSGCLLLLFPQCYILLHWPRLQPLMCGTERLYAQLHSFWLSVPLGCLKKLQLFTSGCWDCFKELSSCMCKAADQSDIFQSVLWSYTQHYEVMHSYPRTMVPMISHLWISSASSLFQLKENFSKSTCCTNQKFLPCQRPDFWSIAGPLEFSIVQTLLQEYKPIPVKIEGFHCILFASTEQKDHIGKRLHLEVVPNDVHEPVKRLSHIRPACNQIDFLHPGSDRRSKFPQSGYRMINHVSAGMIIDCNFTAVNYNHQCFSPWCGIWRQIPGWIRHLCMGFSGNWQ